MSSIFYIPSYLVFGICGIWGWLLSMAIAIDHLGFLGAFLAFFFTPVTVMVAPWYEGIANSNWFLLALIYGGGLSSMILSGMGAFVEKKFS